LKPGLHSETLPQKNNKDKQTVWEQEFQTGREREGQSYVSRESRSSFTG
jgi:hypothetical protein